MTTMIKTQMEMTDGYKLDHRRQYPKGTEFVYSNWTPRSNAYFPEGGGEKRCTSLGFDHCPL